MRAKSLCRIMMMVVLVGLPSHLFAETPIQALQATIDRLQQALRDPHLGEEIRAKQVWDILLTRFDVREMSKRILGSYWEEPVEQQEAFLAEFTAFMNRTFAQKLEKLKDARMICRAEEIQGSIANVMTSLYLAEEEVN